MRKEFVTSETDVSTFFFLKLFVDIVRVKFNLSSFQTRTSVANLLSHLMQKMWPFLICQIPGALYSTIILKFL